MVEIAVAPPLLRPGAGIRDHCRGFVALVHLDTLRIVFRLLEIKRGLGGFATEMNAEFGPPLEEQDIGNALTEHLEEAGGSESIAIDSGGFVVSNNNDLLGGIQRIAKGLDSRHEPLLHTEGGRHVHCRGERIVRRLRHVHVVIGMNRHMAAQ